jgi:hypothetical protein
MIATIINSNKIEDIVRIGRLLKAQGKLDDDKCLLDFSLRILNKEKLSKFNKKYHESKYCKRSFKQKPRISIQNEFIENLSDYDLEIFLNRILKLDRRDVKNYLNKNYEIVAKIKSEELFSKIIYYLNDKKMTDLFINFKLTEYQVEALSDRGLCLNNKILKNCRFKLNNIYNYIVVNETINYNLLLSFLSESKGYHWNESLTKLKFKINKVIRLLLRKDDKEIVKILKDKSGDLNFVIDNNLIKNYEITDTKNILWKLKNKYNEVNKIEYNSVFYDTYMNDLDKIYQQQNYDFCNLTQNKMILKELYSKTFQGNYIVPYYYRAIHAVKEIFNDVDEQLLIPLFSKNYDNLKFIFNNKNELSYLKVNVLDKEFISRKIFNIITKDLNEEELNCISDRYFKDIVDMYDKLKIMGWNKKINKKNKNVVLLHDFLSSELSKQSQENYYLNQDSIKFLNGQEFDSYIIKVPQTNHDLVEVGSLLRHCVGNGTYSMRVLKKELKIIAMYRKADDKLISCIALNAENYNVEEARSKGNELFKFDHSKLIKMIKKGLNS